MAYVWQITWLGNIAHINSKCCIDVYYDETFLDFMLLFGLKHLQQWIIKNESVPANTRIK